MFGTVSGLNANCPTAAAIRRMCFKSSTSRARNSPGNLCHMAFARSSTPTITQDEMTDELGGLRRGEAWFLRLPSTACADDKYPVRANLVPAERRQIRACSAAMPTISARRAAGLRLPTHPRRQPVGRASVRLRAQSSPRSIRGYGQFISHFGISPCFISRRTRCGRRPEPRRLAADQPLYQYDAGHADNNEFDQQSFVNVALGGMGPHGGLMVPGAGSRVISIHAMDG